MHDLTEMDYVRAALYNARASNLSLTDVIRAAEHAESVMAFDDAVNILGEATPRETGENYD